jgi:Undecaprenyl-phosphate glucose phosphotransferase
VSVTAFVGGDLSRPATLGGRRISLQQTVVTFLLIELGVFWLGAIAPSFCLEKLGLLVLTREQFDAQLAAAVAGTVIYLCAARLYPVYAAAHILDAKLTLKRLALVLVATFAALVAISAATKTTQQYSRLWFFSWATIATDMILFARLCALTCVNARLQRGACIYRALSLGLGAPALNAEQLLMCTSYRARAVRCQNLSSSAELDNLIEAIRTYEIDQVYISVPWTATPELAGKMRKLRHLAVDVFLYCNDQRLHGEVLDVLELGDGLAFQAGVCPIAGWDRWIKRCEDVVISMLALAAASPVLLLTALAIKLESRGPIFFRQIREGFNGIHFEVLKFRSMFEDDADPHGSRQTSKCDARVTRVGRIIRRFSIDELPQLFNVLQGSMSLVGPRPHPLRMSAEGKALNELVEYYASRHRVKTGMTGWAQVNGLRGEANSAAQIKARVDHDLYYIQNWSIWLDLKIIARTAATLIFDRRAY